jgi:shikimate kinase
LFSPLIILSSDPVPFVANLVAGCFYAGAAGLGPSYFWG